MSNIHYATSSQVSKIFLWKLFVYKRKNQVKEIAFCRRTGLKIFHIFPCIIYRSIHSYSMSISVYSYSMSISVYTHSFLKFNLTAKRIVQLKFHQRSRCFRILLYSPLYYVQIPIHFP